MTIGYQLILYRHATVLFNSTFQRLATAKQIAKDNLHEYAANTAIIRCPRGTISKTLGADSKWQRID